MSPSKRTWLRSPSERVGTLSHADLPPPSTADLNEEHLLLLALRDRDEAAFDWLLEQYYSPMLRLAQTFVRSSEEAEEVVQDAWHAVLAGLDSFEERSSLKTWIFRILVNRARSRAKREARQVPFSSLPTPADTAYSDRGSAVPDWLLQSEDASALRWCGQGWSPVGPEEAVLSQELIEIIEAAIATLPQSQQNVITLRDMEGWTPAEVCELLGISEPNQRVLLHRGRLKVRNALEKYFSPAEDSASVSSSA